MMSFFMTGKTRDVYCKKEKAIWIEEPFIERNNSVEMIDYQYKNEQLIFKDMSIPTCFIQHKEIKRNISIKDISTVAYELEPSTHDKESK